MSDQITAEEMRRRLHEQRDRARGGRPMSRTESLQRGRAESPPELAPVESGVWAREGVIMRCRACPIEGDCEWAYHDDQGLCAWERHYRDTRRPRYVQEILDAGGDPDLHGPEIDMLVSAEVRLYRAERYCAIHGEIRRHEGDHIYTGVAKHIDRLQAAVRAARENLNLSRAAIARLEAERRGHQPIGAAATIQALDSGAIDVEFSAADEADGDGGEGEGG